MIPKKIHYCWFSGKKMPKEFENYIETWKKFCPDYEIVRWDESNYDINQNSYMRNAYKEKRWGFVPDYARFDIIYREGGIYLDTDVELIKSPDSLLDNPAFLGFEDNNFINPGLGFGAEKNNPVMKALRDIYENIDFYKHDGSLNLVPSPYYVTEKLKSLGVKTDNQLQRLDDITIYPSDYFGAKNYYTGKINSTENTYSVHHFSCTWMTREERKAEERRRTFCARYGQFLGNRIDGVYKRIVAAGDKRKKEKIFERVKEHFIYSERNNEKRLNNYNTAGNHKNIFQQTVLLSPAVKSVNIGDEIIEKMCLRELNRLGINENKKISTHYHPSKGEIKVLKSSDLVLVTGSNLLSNDIHHCQWKLPSDYNALANICLMGCGFGGYGECNDFSKRFYDRILNNGRTHSVRDRYTLERLKEAGVKNVLYTGCPTMWNLTEEHCSKIAVKKSKNAVTALTSYQSDYDMDSFQMQMLFDHYEKVYFWPQGKDDIKYLNRILTESEKKRIVILERNINRFVDFLKTEKPDYVGNRLHAGILALNIGCRSLIIAIDNRAVEIGKDTELPVIIREELKEKMEAAIYSDKKISIVMPWDNIEQWKKQFKEV